MPRAFRPGKTGRSYQVGIIEREPGWNPEHWCDVPATAQIVRIVAAASTFAGVLGWVFGFNSSALAGGGVQWAVILERGTAARPGDKCICQPVCVAVRRQDSIRSA